MRKILLASAAMLGATAGIASAQAPVPAAAAMMMQPTQGQFALPWAQGPTVNNNNNTLEATGFPAGYKGGAAYGRNAVPSPGTVVIRLNGRVEADMIVGWSTNHQVGATATAPGFKSNPVIFGAYARLYPGVDGMATNGLRYGAAVELRENYASTGNAAQPGPALGTASTATGAGAAATYSIGGGAPSPSAYNSSQTIFARRAFAYLAHENFGLVRMGTTDGVIGLFDPGIFSGQGYDGGHGGLNGASHQGIGVNGAAAVPFALAQAGAEYGNTKIVYMSPQFFGFDFGVQYAPSMGNANSTCATAGFGCNSTTTGNDPTRWYNQVAVGARYQGVFGPVNFGIFGVYEAAAKETFFGSVTGAATGPAAIASGRSGFGQTGTKYDNLGFINAATYITFNSPVGQFTTSANYIGGAVNGQLAMKPTGGVNENHLLLGFSYRNGPFVIGTQAEFVNSQGDARLTGVSQRREFALAVGGAYTLAPGVVAYAEYQYAYRHQGGFDFVAGGLGGGATGTPGITSGATAWKAGATRDAHGQALLLGTAVSW